MPSVVNIFTSKEVKLPRHPFMNDPLFRRFFGDPVRWRDAAHIEPRLGRHRGHGGLHSDQPSRHRGGDEIEIALNDGRQAKAKAVGTDPESDLAVLKIDLKNLPAVTFGRLEQVNVGDVVLAIGNPFGVGQTVTMGIVSALGRTHLGINTFENFIQTDAAINPGNSGGALVDANGNLIGVNTAIYSRSGGSMGIGFAIPVSLARQVMDQIIATGSVTRGWIGVEVQDITPELAESFKLSDTKGVLIAGVVRGGPADKAGVKPGDILVEVEGKPVPDSSAMLNLVAKRRAGQSSDTQSAAQQRPAGGEAHGRQTAQAPSPSRRRGVSDGSSASTPSELGLGFRFVWAGAIKDATRMPTSYKQTERQRQQDLRCHVGRRDYRGDDECADDHVGPDLPQFGHRHHSHSAPGSPPLPALRTSRRRR